MRSFSPKLDPARRRFIRAATLGIAGLAGGITLASIAPRAVVAQQVDEPRSLSVTDLAGKSTTYTLDQLQAMPQTSVEAALWCDDTQISNSTWTGVDLGYLLQGAGSDQKVVSVEFRAADGYSLTMPAAEALHWTAIIAFAADGSDLLEGLRLVVPGENGNSWMKKLTSMTMLAAPTANGPSQSAKATTDAGNPGGALAFASGATLVGGAALLLVNALAHESGQKQCGG